MIETVERLLAPRALDGLTTRPIADLRRLRSECSKVENDISMVRRVAQGRLDIVGHEVRRRAGVAEGEADLAGLLFDMPEILSDASEADAAAPVPGGRQVEVSAPGTVALELVERLDATASVADLSQVDELTDDELRDLFERIREFEVEMSSIRRQLHDRIDTIQGEIGRRYRDGEASVDALLP